MRTVTDIYIKALLHFLIWSLMAVILFFYPVISNKGIRLPADFVTKQIIHFCLMVLAYYLNTYLFVPKLLLNRKYALFAVILIIISFLSSHMLATVESWLNLREQMKGVWNKRTGIPWFDLFGFLTTLITLGISTSVGTIQKLNRDNKELLNLERERTNMELSMLKSQIRPHFFFNTLNTIYALSYTDAEASRKATTKLSRIMRYVLYETSQNITTLSKELEFISSYTDIMKLRLNGNTTVDLQLPDAVLPMQIAPMILMPYIENVFKHGIDENGRNTLVIIIAQHAKGVQLTTRNKIAARSPLIRETRQEGIGMLNTKRRLELSYRNRYKLCIQRISESNEFELKLEIELT